MINLVHFMMQKVIFLGAPDGGFGGGGDGRITDFFTERKNEKLIWKNSRQP